MLRKRNLLGELIHFVLEARDFCGVGEYLPEQENDDCQVDKVAGGHESERVCQANGDAREEGENHKNRGKNDPEHGVLNENFSLLYLTANEDERGDSAKDEKHAKIDGKHQTYLSTQDIRMDRHVLAMYPMALLMLR